MVSVGRTKNTLRDEASSPLGVKTTHAGKRRNVGTLFAMLPKLRSGISLINQFIIRLIKLRIADIWRIGASGLSLLDGCDKYAYIHLSRHPKTTRC